MARRMKMATEPVRRVRPGVGPGLLLAEKYCEVRFATEALCDPLKPEDLTVQSMPDASPIKWHLAHTSWFFEKFVVAEAQNGYQSFSPAYDFLFNSYYESQGDHARRELRGTQSRPTIEEVFEYRRHVDAHVLALLCAHDVLDQSTQERIALGLHHEQQHQELILTDIKHALAQNPLRPCYSKNNELRARLLTSPRPASPLTFKRFATSLAHIGAPNEGFAFDNERPRHQALIHEFELATRLTTCGEYAAFIDDGGYERPELWLSDGWQICQREGFRAPLYWFKDSGRWYTNTLNGPRLVSEAEPVCHVSYYEADAFARWQRARLATEQEWEVAAADVPMEGNFLEGGVMNPIALADNEDSESASQPPMRQMFGDVWEWTASPYVAYPGFRPWAGALGEYNAKFMCNQFVLRGGSCVTPRSHMRSTYRNYFPPATRWQFSGIRLARSSDE